MPTTGQSRRFRFTHQLIADLRPHDPASPSREAEYSDEEVRGDGARAATPTGSFRVPALKVEPVDTVGAGDTFCGYLAAGLDQGLDLEAAMKRAAVAASLAVLKPGAQPSVPYVADVEKAMRG